MSPRSALYDAVLEHERYAPAHNAFRYRIYQLLLDLDELDELADDIPFLSVERRNLVEVRAADHLGDPRLSIRDNVRAWLDERGVSVPDGRIELLTHARTFGYVFNPVSFYFVRDRDDAIACVVAEVHNTFGERWPYLLGAPGELDRDGRMRFSTEKRFHVSPFMGVAGTYEFLLGEPGERLMMRIDEELEGRRLFRAVLTGERRPLTSAALAHALVRYPWVTGQVMARIHWQALQALAQARAVPPQAALRPGARVDADMSRVEREPAAANPRSAPGLLGAISRRVLERALSGIADGALELRAPDGTRRFGDPAAEPSSSRCTTRAGSRGSRAPAASRSERGTRPVSGRRPICPDSIALLARNQEQVFGRPPLSLLADLARLVPNVELPRGLRRSERDVHAHYDLGNASSRSGSTSP